MEIFFRGLVLITLVTLGDDAVPEVEGWRGRGGRERRGGRVEGKGRT